VHAVEVVEPAVGGGRLASVLAGVAGRRRGTRLASSCAQVRSEAPVVVAGRHADAAAAMAACAQVRAGVWGIWPACGRD